jgi:hypothetical protein
LTDDDIKSILALDQAQLQINIKLEIIKRFIKDKANEEVDLVIPSGQLSFIATAQAGRPIADIELCEYFFSVSYNYYKDLFKSKENNE